jgi:Calcineurin-like phosphoesterase
MSDSRVVRSIDDDVDLSKPTLLCISDLEGCIKVHPNGEQSRALCQRETFDKLIILMNTKPELQIAFLGDYFDQGDMIEESIAGIVHLKTAHNDRVHIILGNRDVNKMRICVEAKFTMGIPDQSIWKMWRDFFHKDPHYDPTLNELPRIQQLLQGTFGAKDLLKYVGGGEDQDKGLTRMKAIFDTGSDEDSFVINCRSLFNHGKIIEIINLGETKVLVSHAGTYNVRIFEANAINIAREQSVAFSQDTYFNQMEEMRKILGTYVEPNVVGFDAAINSYNTLYQDVISKSAVQNNGSLSDNISSDPELYKKYLLLQAMGLRGDDDSNFISPIHSCGLDPCNVIKEMPEGFDDLLKSNRIVFIAHGHVPFCGTVPLIHKDNEIGILSCDTSNGNRPKAFDSLDKIPLGYIQPDGMGIASIFGIEASNLKLSREHTRGFNNKVTDTDTGTDKREDEFAGMIQHFSLPNLPVVSGDRTSVMIDGEVIFHFNGGFLSATGKNPDRDRDRVEQPGGSMRRRRLSKKSKSKKQKSTRKIRRRKTTRKRMACGCSCR